MLLISRNSPVAAFAMSAAAASACGSSDVFLKDGVPPRDSRSTLSANLASQIRRSGTRCVIATAHVVRQEITSQGGRVDLLAIAPDASLVLIELKRSRTPREIVAQALDYASWVERLSSERIAQIYHRFSNGRSLDGEYQNRFGNELDEDALNESHQIVVVATELDDSTERIISYLNARDIAINVLFF